MPFKVSVCLLVLNILQPVELINLYRSTPLINYIRPGDAEEAVVCELPFLAEVKANLLIGGFSPRAPG